MRDTLSRPGFLASRWTHGTSRAPPARRRFRARACTTLGTLRHPTHGRAVFRAFVDTRLASLALATRGHERIARSLRARALAPSARGRRERPGDFPPRARSTGARAPPRSTLTSIPSSLCCCLDRRRRARARDTSALCAAAARFLHSGTSRTTQVGGAVPPRMLLFTPAPPLR